MRVRTGRIPSQSDLCTTYIATFVFEPYKQLAAEQLQQDDTAQFRFFYDFAMGIAEITSRLYGAEEARAGRTKEMFQEYREQAEGIFDEGHLDTRADDYVVISGEAENADILFEEDPSGFLLIDRTLAELESWSSPLQYSSRSKEFTLAGAQLAAFLYKNSYEISEDLYH